MGDNFQVDFPPHYVLGPLKICQISTSLKIIIFHELQILTGPKLYIILFISQLRIDKESLKIFHRAVWKIINQMPDPPVIIDFNGKMYHNRHGK